MNYGLLTKLWEESTGTSYPNAGQYRSVANYNIESFAKSVIEECIKSANESDSDECGYVAWYMIEKKFEIKDKT